MAACKLHRNKVNHGANERDSMTMRSPGKQTTRHTTAARAAAAEGETDFVRGRMASTNSLSSCANRSERVRGGAEERDGREYPKISCTAHAPQMEVHRHPSWATHAIEMSTARKWRDAMDQDMATHSLSPLACCFALPLYLRLPERHLARDRAPSRVEQSAG